MRLTLIKIYEINAYQSPYQDMLVDQILYFF
jgi:hypothetical protein